MLFTTAGQLLGELVALDSDSALRRRLRHYASPDLLAIDEVGYLSYSNRCTRRRTGDRGSWLAFVDFQPF